VRHDVDPPTPVRVSQAVRFVSACPDDGRSWLFLGRLLQVEGRSRAARRAYEIALRRLKRGYLARGHAPAWVSLAHALLIHHPGDFAQRWWTYVSDEAEGASFIALNQVLTGTNMPLYIAALARGVEVSGNRDLCERLLREARDGAPPR
jgi:hypothetical protein